MVGIWIRDHQRRLDSAKQKKAMESHLCLFLTLRIPWGRTSWDHRESIGIQLYLYLLVSWPATPTQQMEGKKLPLPDTEHPSCSLKEHPRWSHSCRRLAYELFEWIHWLAVISFTLYHCYFCIHFSTLAVAEISVTGKKAWRVLLNCSLENPFWLQSDSCGRSDTGAELKWCSVSVHLGVPWWCLAASVGRCAPHLLWGRLGQSRYLCAPFFSSFGVAMAALGH